MTDITRFPHYHQAENVVTNHVMVMLRTVYKHSPKLLEGLLQALCGNEITVGPSFSQQVAGAHSIPDGLILQEPMAVFIETKLGAHLNHAQLAAHCRTIAERARNRGGNYLIALTTGEAGKTVPPEVSEMADQRNITIVETSFRDLVEQLAALRIHDVELNEVVQEFTDFIYAQGLVPRQDQFLVGMLTGTSWEANRDHGVYYEPIDRNPKWQRASFLGLYHHKRVSHVGRIVTVASAIEDAAGALDFDKPELGTLDDQQRGAVRACVDAAQDYYPDFQATRHRYYVVDAFAPTNFRKTSPGGMMGHRYFDVEAVVGARVPAGASGVAVAALLNGKSFI
jgi:hypothetical protein